MQSKDDRLKKLEELSSLISGSTVKSLEPSKEDGSLFSMITNTNKRITLFGSDLGWWFDVQELRDGLWLYPTLVAMLQAAYRHDCRVTYQAPSRLLVDDRPFDRIRGYKCSLCGEEFHVTLSKVKESTHPYQPYLLTPDGSQKIADWFLAPWEESPESYCVDESLPLMP